MVVMCIYLLKVLSFVIFFIMVKVDGFGKKYQGLLKLWIEFKKINISEDLRSIDII